MKPHVEILPIGRHDEKNNPLPISYRSETHDDCSSNEDISSGSHVVPINQDQTQDGYPLETIAQEHARPRRIQSTCLSRSSLTKFSNTSLTASITKFRTDFEDLKCKMQIFGESLNLCKCIASDFKGKLQLMEKRLQKLEKRQTVCRTESNFSAIINLNKMLSQKTRLDAKKLQMCGTEAEMREVAGRMCRNYLHGAWKTVNPIDLDFRRISGGLSNFLYYVALPDDISSHLPYVEKDKEENEVDEEHLTERRASLPKATSFLSEEPNKVIFMQGENVPYSYRVSFGARGAAEGLKTYEVLLRIYGQVHGDRAMDAIVTESVIFTLLSERKLGPKLYGVFSGGRIEQYIPARPLLTRELSEPALSMKIAEKMAAIHSMDVPLSKEPKWLWKKMNNWLRTVREERLKSVEKNAKEREIQSQLKLVDFEKELEWVRKLVLSVESPSVFCHNDMQEGNILLLEEEPNTNEDLSPRYITCEYESTITQDDANTSDSITSRLSDIGEPKLVLIDFEYCAYNYRGFDIANHFAEWVIDYTNPSYPFYFEYADNAPTLEQKEIFIKEYLKHYNAIVSGEQEPSIDDINKVLAEVDAFSIVTHLFWSLWSFVNASKSQIPFGYWEYGLMRLQTYQRLKQEHIKKESSGIPKKRKICEVDI